MPSNKFLRIAHEIAQRDKPVFDALLEFERTKRVRTKERLSFTVDRALARRFRAYCREHGYNMSAKVEKAIWDLLEKEKR